MSVNHSHTILIQEASEALVEKLGVSKASEFWSNFGYSKKDYVKLRKQLFGKEKVGNLYKKIKQFERQ